MSGLLTRLWHLATPTDESERTEAERRTCEQERIARIETDHHRWHRERNHFADRISAAFKEDARWS